MNIAFLHPIKNLRSFTALPRFARVQNGFVCFAKNRLLRRYVLPSLVACIMQGAAWWLPASAQGTKQPQLSGGHVAEIARVFLRSHVLREKFEIDHANLMLKHYVNNFDPERIYFLQEDLDTFLAQAKYLTRDVLQGRIGLANNIYQRLLQRIEVRERFLAKLLKTSFKISPSQRFPANWRKLKNPKTRQEAEEHWRLRLSFQVLERMADGQTLKKSKQAFQRRYANLHSRIRGYTQGDILAAFLNAFTSAYDPHSAYLTGDDLENFYISMRLSLEGIGATLRWEDGRTVIASIIHGGAAANHGGLKTEDVIVEVAQKKGRFEDVTNMRLTEVVKRIRGPRGTVVHIAVLRPSTEGRRSLRKEFSITREKIVLRDGEAKAKVYNAAKPKTAKQPVLVIELPSFYVDFSERRAGKDYKSASRDVARLLHQHIQNVQGVILDLRNNGGGGLGESIAVAGLFIPSGPVVQVRSISKVDIHNSPAEKPLYRGPLIVLVNRYSASASEIVAGALQDYGRAVVVGERATFGKGTVQNIIELPQKLGALKTTVQKFYLPSGKSTQHRGVTSDITLPSLNNHLDIGEAALENPLPWDAIRTAKYRVTFPHPPVFIAKLNQKSKQRRAQVDYFKQMEVDVKKYLANRKNKAYISAKEMLVEAKEYTKKKGKQTKGVNAEETPKKDPVLKEVLAIMRDYIGALRKVPGKARIEAVYAPGFQ